MTHGEDVTHPTSTWQSQLAEWSTGFGDPDMLQPKWRLKHEI